MDKQIGPKDENRFFPGAKGLVDAEEAFSRFFNLLPDPACLISRDGLIKKANAAWETSLGYTPQGLSESWLTEILHPEDQALTLGALAKHLDSSARNSFLSRCRSKSGDYRWLEWQVSAAPDSKWLYAAGRDVTTRVQAEELRAFSLKIINRLNQEGRLEDLIADLLNLLRDFSRCSAVGIRLKNGDDFPYYQTMGFPEKHLELENRLCQVDEKGQPLKDARGNPVLECMCGNILCSRFDPRRSFFTFGGSFWSNCTSELLSSTSDAERLSSTRNRCNGEGYESVALIPLKTTAGRIIGLIQLNDIRTGRFSLEMINTFEELAKNVALVIERKQNEKLLRDREEHLRLATRGAELGTYSYDFVTRQGYWSPELKSLLGLKGEVSEEWFKSLTNESIATDDLNWMFSDQTGTNNPGGEGLFQMERKVVRADGSVRWLRTSGRIEFNGEGKRRRPRSAAGVVIDITKSKLAEEKLKQSEAKFSQLFNMVQVPLAICELKEMRFVDVNDAFLKQGGLTRQEIIGYPAPNLDWQSGDEAFKFTDQVRREGKVKEIEMALTIKSGELRTILLSAEIVNLGGADYLISSSSDITERKKMEEALAASEQKYRMLVEKLSEGIWVLDPQSVTTFVNPRMAEILGYKAEEMVGKSLFSFLQGPAISKAKESITRQQAGMGGNHEIEMLRRNGEPVFLSLKTSPIIIGGTYSGSLASVEDITASREARRALIESEEKYRALFENSIDGAILGRPDGSIIAVNREACRMFGLSEREFLEGGREAVADLSDPRWAVALQERSHTGRFKGELTYKRSDGTVFTGETSTAYFENAKATVINEDS